MKKEEIYRSVEVTDNVQTSALSILDQIRLIFASLSNDDAAELDKEEKLSTDKLLKIASLTRFIDETIKHMREKEQSSATVKLSSEYKPYFKDVFEDPNGYGRYFTFKVVEKSLPLSVKHYVIVNIRKR